MKISLKCGGNKLEERLHPASKKLSKNHRYAMNPWRHSTVEYKCVGRIEQNQEFTWWTWKVLWGRGNTKWPVWHESTRLWIQNCKFLSSNLNKYTVLFWPQSISYLPHILKLIFWACVTHSLTSSSFSPQHGDIWCTMPWMMWGTSHSWRAIIAVFHPSQGEERKSQ